MALHKILQVAKRSQVFTHREIRDKGTRTGSRATERTPPPRQSFLSFLSEIKIEVSHKDRAHCVSSRIRETAMEWKNGARRHIRVGIVKGSGRREAHESEIR